MQLQKNELLQEILLMLLHGSEVHLFMQLR
jgi:hypothetical protein